MQSSHEYEYPHAGNFIGRKHLFEKKEEEAEEEERILFAFVTFSQYTL